MSLRAFTAGLCLLLAGCSGYKATATSAKPVASITVNGLTTGLNIGQTAQLTVTATDGAGGTVSNPGTVTWTSSVPTVATVDQTGKVTAAATGNTIITATTGGVSGTLNVRVNIAGTT